MAETVIGMHNLDLREEVMVHVRAVQGECVKVDIPVNGIRLVRTREIDGFSIIGYPLNSRFFGYLNLEQLISNPYAERLD